MPPGTQTTTDGATVVPTYQSVEPSRAWENMGAGGTADGPRIPSGEASAFLAPQRRQRRGSDSDADSEATEGCDDVDDIDEGMLTSLTEPFKTQCNHSVTLQMFSAIHA